MKYLKTSILLLLGVIILASSCKDDEPCIETTWYEDADGNGLGNPDVSLLSCDQPDGYVADNTDNNNRINISTPISAFDDFNSVAVSFSFDGDEITVESNGMPNHTSPYWPDTEPLYIEQLVGDHLTPGRIRSGSYSVTLPATPQLASSNSATGLGAIGISVTGAPIFNDQERENLPLDVETASGFDYAGGHVGPGGYHYHIESSNIEENTILSFDDDQLVGIMADGFLIYGRKCNALDDHPTDLDESGGHFSPTQHSEGDEFYHYHIINEYYINSYILLFGGDLKGTPNTIF